VRGHNYDNWCLFAVWSGPVGHIQEQLAYERDYAIRCASAGEPNTHTTVIFNAKGSRLLHLCADVWENSRVRQAMLGPRFWQEFQGGASELQRNTSRAAGEVLVRSSRG
jgi:hypothetical protein